MRILLSLVLLLLFVPQWMGNAKLELLGRVPRMTSNRVALDPADPARTRVGDLVWLGGVQLHGPDAAFGGFSSLHVEGGRFTLLSDGGNIVRFRMNAAFRIAHVDFAELPDGPGAGWAKRDRDSESMTVDPATGRTWVGFESYNAIWRYDRRLAHAQAHAAPPAMDPWPENLGPEAMTRLSDGRFVVIAEHTSWAEHGAGSGGTEPQRAAILFSGDPTEHPRAGFRWSYVPPAGYDVSDMTVLPDGRLLILVRSYDLRGWLHFSAKLVVLDPKRIRPAAVLRGREIATFVRPLTTDNYEGVAAVREGSDTVVWLVSDDNQSILQRSLLLKFKLDPVRTSRPTNAKSPDR